MKKNICGVSDEYLKASGIYSLYSQYSKSNFICKYLVDSYGSINDIDNTIDKQRFDYHLNRLKSFDLAYFDNLFYDNPLIKYRLETLNNNNNHRFKRLYNYIESMLFMYPKNCYFLTLTFKPDILNKYKNQDGSYNSKLLYRLVQRYLKSECKYYIANIDFGAIDKYIDRKGKKRDATHHLHYHAILIPNNFKKINLKKWIDKYGICYIEKCRVSLDDAKKLGHYITKLSQHAFKISVDDNKVIYSSNMKDLKVLSPGFELFGADLIIKE